MNFMKINLRNLSFNIYSFLFIFTMINREFLFFGIDLRYILLPLSLVIIFMCLINKKSCTNSIKENDPIFKILLIFILWNLFSNISWINSSLLIYPNTAFNQNILIINNLLALMVYYLNKDIFDSRRIKKSIIISCLVLALSFALIGSGFSLSQISGSDTRSMVYASDRAADHVNIFGGKFRLAGYAEDPNYASLFFVIGISVIFQITAKKSTKFLLIMVFLICFGFACSKTILLSFMLGLVFLFVTNYKGFRFKDSYKFCNFLLLSAIVLAIIVLPSVSFFSSHTTMTTRFKMWGIAKDLFLQSPIIGNGIDSFKSYINIIYHGTWYVQSHSTYWQQLSETGLVGFSLLILLLYRCLNKKNNIYNKFLLVIFIIYIINFETVQLEVFIYIIYILTLLRDEKEIVK